MLAGGRSFYYRYGPQGLILYLGVGSPTHYCAATRTGTASAFGPLIN
ncbi:hypothetical protein L195_g057716 [Trifolium pratense]|uniref:Uncharacterized protein n=1 Tax=Trifolium pratense TaxID=57577 RepID=A0A2K3KWU2_TRIPR|nr:hypothetical protein L195_g057716 [Trifolium pratense]